MTDKPKTARPGVKSAGKRHRPHSRRPIPAPKNTAWTVGERVKERLPGFAAVSAAEGWLILAAYALGLGVPLSDLGVDTTGFIAVAVAVFVANAAIIFTLAARKHATTRWSKAAGMTLGMAVLAGLSTSTGLTWLPLTVVGTGLIAWKGLGLVPGPTPSPDDPPATLTMGLVGGGIVVLAWPAAMMLLAGFMARSTGDTMVPLVMQPVVSQQTGHVDASEHCVLRVAERVYIERDDRGEYHVVILHDTPDRFEQDDCNP